MLLAEIASTSEALAETSSRTAKVGLIANLLGTLDSSEAVATVGFLIGATRQGRIGIGWSALSNATVSPATHPSLRVLDVDRALDEVQITTGSGSVAQRNALLQSLFAKATEPEQRFLHRFITGELRQGALEGVMLDAIAKASGIPAALVRRAAMLSGDIRLTAHEALTGGQAALEAVGLKLFQPVLPMLASSASNVVDALRVAGRSSVEWKLDGIRVQIHRSGDDVGVYTRNLNDITERLPDVVAIARSLPCDRALLDGEAIVLDENSRPSLFQETMSEIGRSRGPLQLKAVVMLFDVLHLDGVDLIDRPLSERMHALQQITDEHRIPSLVTDDVTRAEEMLQASLHAGHEGVVIKSLDAPYEAGRRGKAWIKVKKVHTFDLVVLGAEWGHGRRKGWLSNLHLGASDESGRFVMVGKTFKGLTDAMLRWQTEKLLALEDHREGITVFVRPELIAEIALDGVMKSMRYPGGISLRFARVVRYREDKDPRDADTLESLSALLAR